jgi:hypothetical protein
LAFWPLFLCGLVSFETGLTSATFEHLKEQSMPQQNMEISDLILLAAVGVLALTLCLRLLFG